MKSGMIVLALALVLGTAEARVVQAPFGEADGKPVTLFTLSNKTGAEAKIVSYGARLISLTMPDREGHLANVVLGFDTLAPYLGFASFDGATIGRFANRIAGGHFTLDGETYSLPLNNGPNTLHGGKGFDKRLWQAAAFEDAKGPAVRFSYVSADGEEGFPGKLTLRVTYRLGNDNTLSVSYRAQASKPTVVNFTNHSYFNLSGDPGKAIGGNILEVEADGYTPLDTNHIPTGVIEPVAGTRYDFRVPRAIGTEVVTEAGRSHLKGGYDDNWVLNKPAGVLAKACVLSDPESGRVLEVRTTEPGIQIFTGYQAGGSLTGLALETQHFPDSPNRPAFPSTVLRPGQVFKSMTVFAFRTSK
jgi:aldose 1-epimerase